MGLRRKLCVLVFTAMLSFFVSGFLLSTVSAQASFTVHNLTTGLSYETIQEAVDDNATLDGHVIRVDASIHYEHVTLSKAVILVGESSLTTFIDGQGNGTVIDVLASGTTITGFTIRNSGTVSGSSGIHIYPSSSCNVSGNIIDANWYGIWLQSCNNPTVSNNDLTGNYIALYVDSSNQSSIFKNNLSGNEFAVWLSSAENVSFELNKIIGNDHAVWITQAINLSLVDNWIIDSIDGIMIYNSSNSVRMFGNAISSNGDHAVLLTGCTNSVVTGNHISSKGKEAVYVKNSQNNNLTSNVISANFYDGIYLDQSNSNIIDDNIVTESKGAIVIQSSTDNVVSKSSLFGNQQGITLIGSERNVLIQNSILENEYGIHLSGSGNNRVRDNNITENVNEAVYLSVSLRNELINNSISLNGKAVVLWNSDDNLIDDNDIGKCREGISVEDSHRNSILNNTLRSNGAYGLVLRGSSNNTVSVNRVSNNTAGIRLEESSSENVVSDNNVSDNGNGMYIQESSSNDLIQNNVSANDIGILLINSGNNTVAENSLFGNGVGLFLNVSNGNLAHSNILTENIDALELLKSNNNTLQLNVISLNSGTGVNVSFSSFNVFLHNSFFNNALRPASTNSSNIWDNGVEGNFWGYEDAADADRNGVADTPFVIGDGDKDNFPLMAEYLQLVEVIEGVQYPVGIVCNSSISNFRYFRDPMNATSLISFRVNPLDGLGFCRITIPRALIQPPVEITVDNAPPLYEKIVGSNQTHIWLYFSFPIGGNVRIVNAAQAPPFWTEYWFWGVVALALVVGALALAVSLFYRRLGSYKRTVEEVEKKLKEKEQSPLGLARRLFGADVERRSVKIGKFEEKYGVKIRPRESLDEIFKGLEKKEEERKQKDEVNS